MANPLFTMLPFSVNNNTLPVIDSADIERLGVPLELDAYGHWLFGSTSESLDDRIAGRTLTPQNGGVTYPSRSYLNMDMGYQKGILSDFGEISAQTDTIAAVIRLDSSLASLRAVFGSIGDSGIEGGGSVFISSGSTYYINNRGNTITANQDTGIGISTDWVFVAMARDFASVTKRTSFLVGGQPLYEIADGGSYVPTSGFIGLGNPYLSTASSVTHDMNVAEFLIFDRAMTGAELAELYVRSKARMASRGIVVT